MKLINILYAQLDASQRSYFNLAHQIGPYAYPYEEAERLAFDVSGMMPVPNIGSRGFGPFPEQREIEAEIRDVWGEDSIPMHYFREIFRVAHPLPSHDDKNQPVPSTETDRAISL